MEGHMEKFTVLLAEFDTAMLVTRSLRRQLRARPMALAAHDRDDRLLWIPEAPGDPRLGLLWEAGKALVRGERLVDDRLCGHAKLRPDRR